MPKISKPSRKLDTSVYLYDWLKQVLILPQNGTFRPHYQFPEGRLLKVLDVERRTRNDGSYRVKGGLRVLVSDSNQKVFAIFSPEAISRYESEERIRITSELLNMEIVVYEIGVDMLTEREADIEYGYRGNVTGNDDLQDMAISKTFAKYFTRIVIKKFTIGNRDRYMPRDTNIIPYLYTLPIYKSRYLDTNFSESDEESDEMRSM